METLGIFCLVVAAILIVAFAFIIARVLAHGWSQYSHDLFGAACVVLLIAGVLFCWSIVFLVYAGKL